MKRTNRIRFFYEYKAVTLQNREALKAFIESLFKKEKRVLGSLNYIFVSDEYLLQINRDHLQHNFYTDIITFDLSEGKEIEGEIYISVDRVKDNAKTLVQSFKRELHRVIFHGALHLCDYKDKSVMEVQEMRQKEEEYLKCYFGKVPNL